MTKLYPAQQAIVSKLVALPIPRRAILPWDTGCGKTVAACEFIKRTGAQSVLIVCPAIVREHWALHVTDWVGGRLVGVLTEGQVAAANRGAKHAQAHARECSSDVLIVSYDLLNEAPTHDYDLIILDELHHIANPTTKQSKLVKALFRRYPDADIVGLSATLAPTEIQQVWNPLRLFEGEAKWGHPTKRGGIAWSFLGRYCESEKNEWGTAYYGLKPHMADQLRVAMSDVCFPLSRTEVLPDLPPLDLHVEVHDEPWQMLVERFNTVPKLLIMSHRRDDADEIVRRALSIPVDGVPMRVITGQLPIAKRQRILNECSEYERCIISATYDSMLEGIRVLWPDQVIILDWSGSPGRLMQLLGRFVSVGSDARPMVTLVCNDANYAAANAIAQRAPGMIATQLATTGLNDVAAKIEEKVNTAINWDAIFESATSGDWSDDAHE